jgi:hypothetical protein
MDFRGEACNLFVTSRTISSDIFVALRHVDPTTFLWLQAFSPTFKCNVLTAARGHGHRTF